MKRLSIYVLLGLLVVVFLSCSLSLGEKTGELRVVFPEFSSFRTVAPGDIHTVRIYLLQGTSTFYQGLSETDPDSDHVDVPYSEGSHTIEDLYEGTYQVIMEFIGTDTDLGTSVVAKYAVTDPIDIKPSTEPETPSARIIDIPFTVKMAGRASSSVISVGGTVYYMDGTSILDLAGTEYSVPAGSTPHTIVAGKAFDDTGEAYEDELWAVTDDNIYALRDGGTDIDTVIFDFSYLPADVVLDEENRVITGARALAFRFKDYENDTIEENLIYMYERIGGIGWGIAEKTTSPNEWTWGDLAEFLGEVEGLGDLLENLGDDLLVDMQLATKGETNGRFGYAATPLNAYVINDYLIQEVQDLMGGDSEITDLNVDQFLNMADPLAIGATNPPEIRCFALAEKTDKTVLYAGTNVGIWSTVINTSDADKTFGKPENGINTLATKIANTEYFQALSMSASPDGTYVAVAATRRANKKTELLILKGNTIVQSYPFFTGLPGTINDIKWESNTKLVVAGTKGLVTLTFAAN